MQRALACLPACLPACPLVWSTCTSRRGKIVAQAYSLHGPPQDDKNGGWGVRATCLPACVPAPDSRHFFVVPHTVHPACPQHLPTHPPTHPHAGVRLQPERDHAAPGWQRVRVGGGNQPDLVRAGVKRLWEGAVGCGRGHAHGIMDEGWLASRMRARRQPAQASWRPHRHQRETYGATRTACAASTTSLAVLPPGWRARRLVSRLAPPCSSGVQAGPGGVGGPPCHASI